MEVRYFSPYSLACARPRIRLEHGPHYEEQFIGDEDVSSESEKANPDILGDSEVLRASSAERKIAFSSFQMKLRAQILEARRKKYRRKIVGCEARTLSWVRD